VNRNVLAAFALLGLVLGSVGQLTNIAPALLHDSTPRSPNAAMFLLGGVLFLLSTVVVAAVGYRAEREVVLADEFVAFAVTAGVGGGAGYLLGNAATLALAPVPTDGFLLTIVFGSVYGALTKGVSMGLYGLAGAAVAHFRRSAGV
jgi:hypothetical protein